MSRIVVHMAVPDAKRAVAATMSHLSGNLSEHSVELTANATGPSHDWDVANSYSGRWWGASQPFAAQVAQDMLASGYILGTESWFAAFWEDSGEPVPGQHTNISPAPANASFDAFVAAAGLTKTNSSGYPV